MDTRPQKTSGQSIRLSVNTQQRKSIRETPTMYETLGFLLIVGAACGAVLVTIIYDLKVKG
jgi:hypothetical protein